MEKAIKQRLLGGLVLVAGAALFLPVLLDGSGARLATPPIPAAPEVPGVEAIAPVLDEKVATADSDVEAAHADRTFATEESAVAPASEGEVAPDAAALAGEDGGATTTQPASPTAPAASPKVVAPAPAKPAAPAAKPAIPATAAPKAASKPTVAAPLPEAWVVQVASLSSRDKAEALVKKLRAKNYAAVLRPQGSNWRVVVGPELNRTVADSIKARLAADPELKLNGWVQAYKP